MGSVLTLESDELWFLVDVVFAGLVGCRGLIAPLGVGRLQEGVLSVTTDSVPRFLVDMIGNVSVWSSPETSCPGPDRVPFTRS